MRVVPRPFLKRTNLLHTMHSTPSSSISRTVPHEAATPAADPRQAALQPILDQARPVMAFLPIDSGPDAFLRELQRQSAP